MCTILSSKVRMWMTTVVFGSMTTVGGRVMFSSARPPLFATCRSKGSFRKHRKEKKNGDGSGSSGNRIKEMNEVEKKLGFGGVEGRWRCASGCGACCKLDKGPNYPSPREIFPDDPHLAQLVETMTGSDGWCRHYNHDDRTCSIYSDRPFFCRVEPDVFLRMYGIDAKSFNSEACRACRDSIKLVYGSNSQELRNFNSAIANSGAA